MAEIHVEGVTDGRPENVGDLVNAWKNLWFLVTGVAQTADEPRPRTVDFEILIPMMRRVRSAALADLITRLEGHERDGVPGLTAATLRSMVLSALEPVVPRKVRYGLV